MPISSSLYSDTICAVATPYGTGGISVIRLSGPDAIAIADHIYRGKAPLADALPNTAHYGTALRIGTTPSEADTLDEVVCTVFRAPHSFTGEDTVEISCHGSLYIQQELMHSLLQSGARTATAGEFTKRAFTNGKLDLAQAEAVADLIASQSAAESRIALSQLRGGVSQRIQALREQLLTLTSLLELELDFADHEDIEFADRTQLRNLLHDVITSLQELIGSFRAGNAIKQGIEIAIAGAPNSGKSTLLNALVGDDRAIVSDKQGTTRDTIEERIIVQGVPVRITDTAGIHDTQDQIEQMGIQRSMNAVKRAHIVVELLDIAHPTHVVAPQQLQPEQVLLTVYNKVDLLPTYTPHDNALYISAKQGNIQALTDCISEQVGLLTSHSSSILISNARHYEALTRALDAARRVQDGLNNGLTEELIALDLHDCLNALGEITGAITSQDVLNNIFAHFCIGK